MPAQVLDMRDGALPLPEFLVLDTSLLLSLVGMNQPQRQQVATSFLTRISQAALRGELLILVPLLVMEECYYKLVQAYYEAQFGPGFANWHQVGYKQNPGLIANCIPILERFRRDILALPASITGPDDLIAIGDPLPVQLERTMLDTIRSVQILPKDAYILAEASHLGINTLATMDSDWDRADGFVVYRPR